MGLVFELTQVWDWCSN